MLVGQTAIQRHAAFIVTPHLFKRERDAGKPLRSIDQFVAAVPGGAVLVSPEFGTIFNAALMGRGLSPNNASKLAEFNQTLENGSFDGAAVVPDDDRRILSAPAGPNIPAGKLVRLDDPGGVLPARTLSVFASDPLRQADPEATRLLGQVTSTVTAATVDGLLAQAKTGNKSLAELARTWANDKGMKRSGGTGSPSVVSGSSGSSGFSWPTMILTLLIGGVLAFALLYVLGWRPAMAGGPSVRPGVRRAGRGSADPDPTREYRTVAHSKGRTPPEASPPPVALSQDNRVVVGREPKPIAVHLPWITTSADAGLALDGGLLKGTTVRAASVRGRTHSFRGETRQDAYGVRLSSDERWVIAAVADGLGSARHADIAATVGVRAALEGVDAALQAGGHSQNLDWKSVASYVSDTVKRATEALGAPRHGTNTDRTPSARPGTTLTMAVLPAEGEGPAVCAAVGDSPAILVTGGQWQGLVGSRGSLGGNVTTALPGDPGNVEVQPFGWRAGDLLVLSSDGFAAGVAGGQTPLAQRLAQTWRTPPSLPEFVREVDFRLSTFDDDRTVVALWAGRHDTAVS
jgi:hypothetical protein